MATFTHGKKTVFKINATDVSNVLTDVNFPQPVDTAESTAFGNTAKAFVVGLPSGTIALQGNFDTTVDGVVSPLVGSDTLITWEYGPQGSTVTNVKYTGSGIITSYDKTGGVGAIVKVTINIIVSGAVTRATY